ncbi:coiled-coil domain-containing 33 [Pelobates cultripes]|uniref:Coiled-coil domain-containing 33 n=1 Tax=Pelobates cultripes TaxID=61616 RepID=A0AAD1RKM6_PELCU|nr:coiled-coil domain-containing 33 [Pelobates cultripes]
MPAPAVQTAAPPGPPRLRLDEKVLSFEFLLLDVQFNELGQYQLVLRVENPLLDGSVENVQLSVNNGDLVQSNQAESDIVEQADLTETLIFQKNTYLFILPQGLCKNDKHHDVRLSIDVLKVGGGKGKKVGQALFAIYPRTNQPRINLRAAPFEPLYNYQGILALLRVGGNWMAMHCGRLAYNVCFREYKPPKPKDNLKSISPRPPIMRTGTSHPATPRNDPNQPSTSKKYSPRSDSFTTPIAQSSTPRPNPSMADTSKSDTLPAYNMSEDLVLNTVQEHRQSPDSVSREEQDEVTDGSDGSPSPTPRLPVSIRYPDDAPLLLPSPPRTSSPRKRMHVTEKPPTHGEPVYGSHGQSSFLSPHGTETIVVTLHSATHLPSTTAGSAPCPFVTMMSSSNDRNGVKAQSISHTTQVPTHDPTWGETLTMTVSEEEAEQEELLLTVADSPSLDALLSYRLPLRVLRPFHTYHLSMVQSPDQVPGGSWLNVTIQRKSSVLKQQDGFTYSALQVLLVGVETPLVGSAHPVVAVARIVPNYLDYSKCLKPPGARGVPHTTLNFPDPALSSFEIPQTASEGQPQVSGLGLPNSQPIWNSSYLFQGRDGVTLFSEGAALVLEYYTVTNVSRHVPWNLSEYCGFSVVPLDMDVYHELMSDSNSKGKTFTGVTIQDSGLKTASGELPSVLLKLLLLRMEVRSPLSTLHLTFFTSILLFPFYFSDEWYPLVAMVAAMCMYIFHI